MKEEDIWFTTTYGLYKPKHDKNREKLLKINALISDETFETDLAKAKDKYNREYPQFYKKALTDIKNIIGEKPIGDYTVDDALKYICLKYSPKVLSYKEFFEYTDNTDCFKNATCFDKNGYIMFGDKIGAATDKTIRFADFIIALKLPAIKETNEPVILAIGCQKRKITGWRIGNNVYGYKELCYALNIFQGDKGDKKLRLPHRKLKYLKTPRNTYSNEEYDRLCDDYYAKRKMFWYDFVENFPKDYNRAAENIQSLIGKKTTGEYTADDFLKFLYSRYSPSIITQRELCDIIDEENYNLESTFSNAVDEPYIDFDGKVGIFKLPAKTDDIAFCDRAIVYENTAIFVPFIKDGKLFDFWFGLNNFGYESLLTELYIFMGCKPDYFSSEEYRFNNRHHHF